MQVEQYWHESTLVDLILVIVKTLLFNLFHRFLHKIWNYSYFLILLKLILLKRAIIKWEILHYSILRVFFSMLIYSELFLTSQFYHNSTTDMGFLCICGCYGYRERVLLPGKLLCVYSILPSSYSWHLAPGMARCGGLPVGPCTQSHSCGDTCTITKHIPCSQELVYLLFQSACHW